MKLFWKKKKDVDREIRSAVVTGATGMLGATLIRNLLEKGIYVTAVVRPGSEKRSNLPAGAERLRTVECELSSLNALTVREKADAFFHFAWEGTYGEPRNDASLQERNVDATLDAIRLAKKLGAKVFIGAGSQAEYGPSEEILTPETACHPDTEYGRAKLKACLYGSSLSRTLGLDFIWTRILSVYGPFDNPNTLIQSAIRALLNTGRFAATKGEQIWDYLYSEDAAEWFYRLSKYGRSREVYLLSGGESKTLRSYLETVRECVRPDGEVEFGALPYREHQVMHLSGEIEKTVQDTKYSPKTEFSEGIAKTMQWIKETRKEAENE